METRSMEHFAGLDVSVNETSVCIVDGTGRIVREVKVASEPDALLAVLNSGVYHFRSNNKTDERKKMRRPP
jgi:transposase